MLRDEFEKIAPVRSFKIITNREDGRSRGFGFVEMESTEGASRAIEKLHEEDFEGRILTVRYAHAKGNSNRQRSGFLF